MNTDILDKFTAHLKNALAKSFSLAAELSSSNIHPEHLLLALLSQRGSMGGEILRQANLGSEALRQMLIAVNQFTPSRNISQPPRLSAESKRAIEKAVLIANKYDHHYVGTEHLLSGILEIGSPVVNAVMTDQEVDISWLQRQITTTLESTSKFPEITETFESGQVPGRHGAETGEQTLTLAEANFQSQKTPALDFFAVDLTDSKQQENIDPVIGRDQEIERLIQILCRRNKNNPVLLGEPGVGKTAIVEGLAKKIVQGDVPEVLADKRILSLDLGLMIAGTIYRGEFEGRIKQIIDEVKANSNVIIFIDEMHNIMGAGSTNGSMDAANLLKPALARGQMRCIGATTMAEYKKHIETDGALERRFQPITVDQPSPEATMEILRGLRDKYEQHHDVSIEDDAIIAAVTLSERYLTDRNLPDKAIDLIDEAAARAHVASGGDAKKKLQTRLEGELEKVKARKQGAVHSENFIEALKLKSEEEKIIRELKKAKSAGGKRIRGGRASINEKHIAEIISQATKIPLCDLVAEERTRLIDLEKLLTKRIHGQTEAIKSVAEMVRRAKAGMAHPQRPLASFMFLGPSGVGKTELAKILGEEVFRDPEAVIRIDMSEFSEGFNMSKLVGAPAGYVGYREETKLTDLVKRKPHALVLFDEIEKAHPDVHNLLLQILEDGHITDATGRKINFKNTIIVMTSNVGAIELKTAGIGFSANGQDVGLDIGQISSTISGELEKSFRPEFINRIDKIVVFRSLDKNDLESIARLHFDELINRLFVNHNIALQAEDSAVKLIADKSWNPDYGARTIRRQLQELIESPLAKSLLSEEYRPGDTIKINVVGDQVVFTKNRKTPTLKGQISTSNKAVSKTKKTKVNAKATR
ncbi:ATP-dependent Clp protease ATP-binding subunit [Patescibacteria group bacterium]|nr:ATP-dependent Clp protease ATP-binding subunit [Patescibacteria group bacterium]